MRNANLGRHKPKTQERDFSLQFASPETVMRLAGAPQGVRTWHCPLPDHPDKNPSFSAARGREPGTTVVACSCAQTKERRQVFLDHFRRLGYRLGPTPPSWTAPPKVKRPASVLLSAAYRALTPSEQTMFHMIESGQDPTYNEMEEAEVRRMSIGPGLRAMQVLGLIGVKRASRAKGCLKYERSHYWAEVGWLRWEPKTPSKATTQAARKAAREAAQAARKGNVDIPQPLSEKTERGGSGLRVREVAVRGSAGATESYVVKDIEPKTQDSTRPASLDVGNTAGSGAKRAKPSEPPDRHPDDPGPTSHDDYGWDPKPPIPPDPPDHPQASSNTSSEVDWRPPCEGQDCGKAGECLRPKTCLKPDKGAN